MHKHYLVTTSKKVDKFLFRHAEIAKRYTRVISYLRENPFSPFVDWKKMKGLENQFRFRIGKYRFLYTVKEEKILIFVYDADSRGDIY